MKPTLLRSILASSLAVAVAACAGTGADSSTFGTRLVDRSQGQALTDEAVQAIEGLYLGELEMVAYDYRPGDSVQASGGFGNGDPSDWSYWIPLQSGHDAGRDNVLKVGEQVDFTAMNGDYARPLEQEFIDAVGSFEIDFFEVYMHRTGVVREGEYYGMNAELNGLDRHPLHKYADWSTVPDHFCTPEYPGFPEVGQDVNVFFARKDWFPAPVVLQMEQNGQGPATVGFSSVELTVDQETKLLSLVNQGTMRRFYDNLVIIPFDGPVVVDLTNGQTGSGSGNTINQSNLRVTVNFDLADIIDDATDWQAPRVVYKGDASNVPFGLSVAFESVP